MEHLNLDFENSVNFVQLKSLFFNRFRSFKLCLVIDSELICYPEDTEGKSDIFWNISSLDDYKDIKIRSYISFSEEVKLTMYEVLLWLHKVSIDLDSKIYVDIEIPGNPLGFSPAWCIDGKTRKIVFDAGDVFEDPEFAHCEPIIDMSKRLDSF